METLIKKSEKNDQNKTFKSRALLCSFLVLFTINVVGAVNAKSSLPVNKEDENAAVAAMQKNADHDELMTYIYMALGVVVILGTAWFTVAGKKKKNGPEVIVKHDMIKHHHSTHDKRYGTNRS